MGNSLRAVAVLTLFLNVLPAFGQRVSARIVGTITDPAGAVLVNVAVLVVDAHRGTNLTTKTNSEGLYVFPTLSPGEYRIEAQLAGFRTSVQESIVLQIDQTARVDLQMQLGQVTEQVSVHASVPLISTETSEVGSVVENKQIVEMPLNGRLNIVGLLVLAPGVQDFESQSDVPDRGINPSIAGGGRKDTYFSLDGASNVETNTVRGLGDWPSIEAIQEFKVISNNASAEFGQGGSQVAVITKGGTNELHGSVLWFNRNRVFAAQNALVKLPQKPGFNRNEFGFSLGGPVVLPHYDGHDKTFFFVNYEGFRLRSPLVVQSSLPTAAMRDGNFAGVANVKDPLTGQPFPDNLIPRSRMDPVSLKLQSFYPAASFAGPGAGGTGINFVAAQRNETDVNRLTARLDHRLTSRDQLSGRYLWVNLGPNPISGTPAIFDVPGVKPVKEQNGEKLRSFVISETHTFSPSVINEFRGSYRHLPVYRTPRLNDFDPATVIPGLPSPAFGGLPTVTVAGFTGLSDTVQGSFGDSTNVQLTNNITLARGGHMIKAGYQTERVDHSNSYNPLPSRGGFTFQNRYSGTAFGNAYADFLLGYPVNTTRPDRGIDTQYITWKQMIFVQDDWKLRPNLTFNLGLRYEYQPIVRSTYDMISSFDAQLGKLLVFGDQYPAGTNMDMVKALPIALAKDVGRPADFSDYIGPDGNNFAPRVGFAWQPFGKRRFVIRSAYGMFYDMIRVSLFKDVATVSFNPPFLAVATFESGPKTPTLTMSNPFPGAGTLPANPSIGAISPGLKNPLIHQWNFTMEYEVAGTALRASYVGNRGTYLLGDTDLNAVRPAPGLVQPRRPYQPYADITWATNNFDSISHQLQIGGKKRYGNGFSFQGEYQFTRALGLEAIEDPFFSRYSRANLSFIRRHAIVGNYIFELPFGKGKRWLKNNKAAQAIAGGWQASGITTFYTGAPFSVGYTNSVQGCPGGRADIVGNPYLDHPTTNLWFNPTAFAAVTGCRYGTSAKNFLFGPNIFTWDNAVIKSQKLKERAELQFRAEFFNILNHPQWGNPRTNISSPQPGQITSTSGERQIQLALKLRW